jgi:hypothetical protein
MIEGFGMPELDIVQIVRKIPADIYFKNSEEAIHLRDLSEYLEDFKLKIRPGKVAHTLILKSQGLRLNFDKVEMSKTGDGKPAALLYFENNFFASITSPKLIGELRELEFV